MLAILLGLLGIFSGTDDTPAPYPSQDSVKYPGHQRIAHDSTGRFVRVNRIFIIGNRLTRDQIILRELTLKSGDIIYSADLAGILELDKKKLVNTRLFNTVDIRMLELAPDEVDLLVDLNERWYTFPAPILSLADRNFNEWWQNYGHDFRRVNYGLKLYQFNMRGRNETLRFLVQTGFVRRFELNYRIPYIDRKQKQGLILDVDFSETKNLAYRTFDHKLEYAKADNILSTTRSGSITYTYRNSFYDTHGLKVEYRNTTIGDTIALLNPNYLGEGKTKQQWAAITYTFVSDHRDYIGYPLKGYHLLATVARTGIPPLDKDVRKFDVSISYSKFFDLKNSFFLSNNIVGYWSTPNTLPYVNYNAMGYRKQFIRGYEVYVVEGPQSILNKTTFKKRIFSRTYRWREMPIPQFRHVPFAIYLKTYADVGYVNNYDHYDLSKRLSNKLLSGGGFGVDIVGSYDAVLRLEYSFSADGNRGLFIHVKREF